MLAARALLHTKHANIATEVGVLKCEVANVRMYMNKDGYEGSPGATGLHNKNVLLVLNQILRFPTAACLEARLSTVVVLPWRQ